MTVGKASLTGGKAFGILTVPTKACYFVTVAQESRTRLKFMRK